MAGNLNHLELSQWQEQFPRRNRDGDGQPKRADRRNMTAGAGLLYSILGQEEEAIALARAALPLLERVSPKDAVKVRRALAE